MYTPRNFRTLASLLDAQPKGLVRMEGHRLLWDHFMASEKLRRLRISPRCYRLLNEARILPENLNTFYTTYRLPDNPFFPLFLSVKRQWFAERARLKEEREAAIFQRVKELPDYRRRSLRILAEFEETHHPSRGHPMWEERLYPKTKKRVEEFHRFREKDWFELWQGHLKLLACRYRSITPEYSEKLLAALVLRCRKMERREVLANYRRLSMEYHPDRGGDSDSFRCITAARDTLLNG